MATTYKRRKGLDGPFTYANGRVLYFDRAADQYWDPNTDFYVEEDEMNYLKGLLFAVIAK